jgi:hypothetical protein
MRKPTAPTADEITNARRSLVTARFQLRIAETVATAKTERHPGDRAAATAHAAQLRTAITGFIAECTPCPTCGKGQTLESLTR